MTIVLDTNVLISALLFRGKAAAVHLAMLEGRLRPLVCPGILAEYRRVLAYAKFGLTKDDVEWLMDEEILPFCLNLPDPPQNRPWIKEDPSDDIFVNLAASQPGSILVSGDRHVLENRGALPVPALGLTELLAKL